MKKLSKKELSEMLKDIDAGKRLADAIVKSTKKGEFADGTGKIPALKDSTIKRREALARVNDTDSDYSSYKSNLTFSGKLLKAVKSIVKTNAIIEIFVSNSPHNAYKGVRGDKLNKGKAVSNRTIAEGQAEQGRDFMRVPKDELKKVTDDLAKRLAKDITKRFGK